MEDCIFCKIVEGKEKADVILETDDIVVFPDANPYAPIHLLIVPKKHVKDITKIDGEMLNLIKKVALQLAEEKKLDGFRLVHNAGSAAIVSHMHVHFMAGITSERKL